MPLSYWVDFCCNDESGEFCERADRILIDRYSLTLDLVGYQRQTMSMLYSGVKTLRFGRATYEVSDACWSVGSACFYRARMSARELSRFLNNVRETHTYAPDSGYTDLWDIWDSPELFTAEMIDRLLEVAR